MARTKSSTRNHPRVGVSSAAGAKKARLAAAQNKTSPVAKAPIITTSVRLSDLGKIAPLALGQSSFPGVGFGGAPYSTPLSKAAASTTLRPLTMLTSVETLGAMIRSYREALKLSQQSFAERAGVGRRFVSELENGKPSLEFDKVLAVARAAGIDLLASPRSPSPS